MFIVFRHPKTRMDLVLAAVLGYTVCPHDHEAETYARPDILPGLTSASEPFPALLDAMLAGQMVANYQQWF